MVPNLALGSAEVTLLEMTVAMDAIAVDIKAIEPRKIHTGTRALLDTRPNDRGVWREQPTGYTRRSD
jgi:hypothetical protein